MKLKHTISLGLIVIALCIAVYAAISALMGGGPKPASSTEVAQTPHTIPTDRVATLSSRESLAKSDPYDVTTYSQDAHSKLSSASEGSGSDSTSTGPDDAGEGVLFLETNLHDEATPLIIDHGNDTVHDTDNGRRTSTSVADNTSRGGGGGNSQGFGGGGGGGGSAGVESPDSTAQAETDQPSPSNLPIALGGTTKSITPAFPGALGFGAYTVGGRGGDVYLVSTLKDSGAGSLRYGIQSATGPRTIIFNISGTIYLSEPLNIDKPTITIAGQSAPEGGITIAGQPVVIKDTYDIIIRHLRIRVGDINATEREPGTVNNITITAKPAKGLNNLSGDLADALRIRNSNRVIVDHLSLGWSMDELLDIYQSDLVTVQNCLLAQSLSDSHHPKGPHGYGALIVGGDGPPNRVSLIRNIFAHNQARNAGFASAQLPDQNHTNLSLEFINNIVFNWTTHASHLTTNDQKPISANIIGNLFIPGPDSIWRERNTFFRINDEPNVYLGNNYYGLPNEPEQALSAILRKSGTPSPVLRNPFPTSEYIKRDKLLTWLGLHAGSFLSRDKIDSNVIDTLNNGLGHIIDSQDDLGGFPVIVEARHDTADTDRDGIPDEWETAQGLDPETANDANHFVGDETTYLERYLNQLCEYDQPLPDESTAFD